MADVLQTHAFCGLPETFEFRCEGATAVPLHVVVPVVEGLRNLYLGVLPHEEAQEEPNDDRLTRGRSTQAGVLTGQISVD